MTARFLLVIVVLLAQESHQRFSRLLSGERGGEVHGDTMQKRSDGIQGSAESVVEPWIGRGIADVKGRNSVHDKVRHDIAAAAGLSIGAIVAIHLAVLVFIAAAIGACVYFCIRASRPPAPVVVGGMAPMPQAMAPNAPLGPKSSMGHVAPAVGPKDPMAGTAPGDHKDSTSSGRKEAGCEAKGEPPAYGSLDVPHVYANLASVSEGNK